MIRKGFSVLHIFYRFTSRKLDSVGRIVRREQVEGIIHTFPLPVEAAMILINKNQIKNFCISRNTQAMLLPNRFLVRVNPGPPPRTQVLAHCSPEPSTGIKVRELNSLSQSITQLGPHKLRVPPQQEVPTFACPQKSSTADTLSSLDALLGPEQKEQEMKAKAAQKPQNAPPPPQQGSFSQWPAVRICSL
jgi:hypothetical protein